MKIQTQHLKQIFYCFITLLLIANTLAGPLRNVRYVFPGGPELYIYTSDCLAYGIGLCIAFAAPWCYAILKNRLRFYLLLTFLVVIFHPVHYFYDLFFGMASHDRLIRVLFDQYDLLDECFNILCVYLIPCVYYEYIRRTIKADPGIDQHSHRALLEVLISWTLTIGIVIFVLCNTAFPLNPKALNPDTNIFIRWLSKFIFYLKTGEVNETVFLAFVQLAAIPIFLYLYWNKTLAKFKKSIFYLVASIWSGFLILRFLLFLENTG